MRDDEPRTTPEPDLREPDLHQLPPFDSAQGDLREPDLRPYHILQQTDGHRNDIVPRSDGQVISLRVCKNEGRRCIL